MASCENFDRHLYLLVFAGYRVSLLISAEAEESRLIYYSFYGINLNQNNVLEEIGYAGTTGTAWENLFKISTGNIIITVLGFVPGKCPDTAFSGAF